MSDSRAGMWMLAQRSYNWRFATTMRPRTPILIIALFSLTLLAASPVAASGDGTVTFRLTIRGTPIPTDSFTLGVNADSGLIISPGVRCGPGTELYSGTHVPCASGDNDFVVEVPIGTQLTYTYARFADYLASGGASGAQILLEGTITVSANPQTVTMVYDYSLGGLPNTAMESPASAGWLLPAGIAIAGGGLLLLVRRRTTRSGCVPAANW
jgi:hypothetical protein